MSYWFHRGLIVLACGVLLTGVARTDENNADISDGPSRKELFLARMAAELGPEAALSSSTVPPFILPQNAPEDSFFGIDVSHYDDENCVCKAGQDCNRCKIDWSRAASQKVSFVYAKATQGTRFSDKTFAFHWRNLAQSGILRGAYHFMSADEDPIAQADYFLDQLEQAGNFLPGDLPPCLDLEADTRKDGSKRWIVDENGKKRDFWRGQDADEIADKILKWMKRVEEKLGRAPIIYTSPGWWNDNLKGAKKAAQLQRYHVWVAHYFNSGSPARGKPDVPAGQDWVMWQFTENGKMKDAEIIPAVIDISIINGSLEKLQSTLGVSLPDKKEIARADDTNVTNTPAQQAENSTPPQPADTSTPTQQATNPTPPQPADTSTPTQQATNPTPPPPTDTGAPAQQATNPTPPQPADTSTPTLQATNPTPPPPADTSTPTQQATNPTPPPPVDTSTPAQQATSANPNPPADKLPEQLASANPSEPKDSGDAANQQPSTTPSDAKQNTGANNSRPRSRNSASRVAQTQTQAPQNAANPNIVAQSTPPQNTMVEIVLVNGRTIRVDATIDPALLARLITAIDGK